MATEPSVDRTVDDLPESDVTDGDGNPAYNGKSHFQPPIHSLKLRVCICYICRELTSSRRPKEKIVRKEGKSLIIEPNKKFMKKQKERIIVYKGKLIKRHTRKGLFW